MRHHIHITFYLDPRKDLKRTPKGPDPACLVEVDKAELCELQIKHHVDKVEM